MARSGHPRQASLFGEAPQAPRARIAPAPPRGEHARVAERLPGALRFGSSSWAFPGWRGLVYADGHPQRELARDGLGAYASHPLLRSVGLDRTYYAPMAREDFAALAASVGESFRFLVKAPLVYTRPARPPEAGSARRHWIDNPLYLDAAHAARSIVEPLAEGLGCKAGPLVFQFSPIPRFRLGDPAAFAERLGAFLSALPSGPLYAVELRNPELLVPSYAESLERAGAAHCFNVHPSMPGIEEQRAALQGAGEPATVVRWMLGHGQPYEDAKSRYAPFDRIVDPDCTSRRAIAGLCAASARASRPAFVIVNNKAEGSAPESVFRLAALTARLLES